MSRFLKALHSRRVLLMDGAMGTELQTAGLKIGEAGEHWNFQHPDRVLAIHKGYVEAGAEVLLTNTFQIVSACIGWRSRPPDQAPNFEEKQALVGGQWAATSLCRAARPDAFVLADIGSYMNKQTGEEFSDYSMLVNAARTLGPVDGVLLETCSTRRVGKAIAKLHAECRGRPLLLSMTFKKDAAGVIKTIDGLPPEWFAEQAESWGLAALGVNCGQNLDLDAITEVIRRYRSFTHVPLFARPNAGTPRKVGRRFVYPLTPAAMARQLPPLLEAGVTMVGGCCGTTPQHIAAIRSVVARWNRA
jgi:5-methyltetrahydrofolate--homocysteine methyltransferase